MNDKQIEVGEAIKAKRSGCSSEHGKTNSVAERSEIASMTQTTAQAALKQQLTKLTAKYNKTHENQIIAECSLPILNSIHRILKKPSETNFRLLNSNMMIRGEQSKIDKYTRAVEMLLNYYGVKCNITDAPTGFKEVVTHQYALDIPEEEEDVNRELQADALADLASKAVKAHRSKKVKEAKDQLDINRELHADTLADMAKRTVANSNLKVAADMVKKKAEKTKKKLNEELEESNKLNETLAKQTENKNSVTKDVEEAKEELTKAKERLKESEDKHIEASINEADAKAKPRVDTKPMETKLAAQKEAESKAGAELDDLKQKNAKATKEAEKLQKEIEEAKDQNTKLNKEITDVEEQKQKLLEAEANAKEQAGKLTDLASKAVKTHKAKKVKEAKDQLDINRDIYASAFADMASKAAKADRTKKLKEAKKSLDNAAKLPPPVPREPGARSPSAPKKGMLSKGVEFVGSFFKRAPSRDKAKDLTEEQKQSLDEKGKKRKTAVSTANKLANISKNKAKLDNYKAAFADMQADIAKEEEENRKLNETLAKKNAEKKALTNNVKKAAKERDAQESRKIGSEVSLAEAKEKHAAAAAKAKEVNEAVKEKERQLDEIAKEIDSLKGEGRAINKIKKDMKQQIKATKGELDDAHMEVGRTERDLGETDEARDKLGNKLEEAEERIRHLSYLFEGLKYNIKNNWNNSEELRRGIIYLERRGLDTTPEGKMIIEALEERVRELEDEERRKQYEAKRAEEIEQNKKEHLKTMKRSLSRRNEKTKEVAMEVAANKDFSLRHFNAYDKLQILEDELKKWNSSLDPRSNEYKNEYTDVIKGLIIGIYQKAWSNDIKDTRSDIEQNINNYLTRFGKRVTIKSDGIKVVDNKAASHDKYVEKKGGVADKTPNNADTFFTYDTHDVWKIIKKELGIKLSDQAKMDIEAILERETRGLRYKGEIAHGMSDINSTIQKIEQYINSRKRIDGKVFKFSEPARFDLKQILKRELKASKP